MSWHTHLLKRIENVLILMYAVTANAVAALATAVIALHLLLIGVGCFTLRGMCKKSSLTFATHLLPALAASSLSLSPSLPLVLLQM